MLAVVFVACLAVASAQYGAAPPAIPYSAPAPAYTPPAPAPAPYVAPIIATAAPAYSAPVLTASAPYAAPAVQPAAPSYSAPPVAPATTYTAPAIATAPYSAPSVPAPAPVTYGQSVAGIVGVAGQDYPVFNALPHFSFKCTSAGYYADVETGCQFFHICQADGRHDVFACPRGTLFNQKYLVCDWWYNVNCGLSANFFSVNLLIGQTPAAAPTASIAAAVAGSSYGETPAAIVPSVSYTAPVAAPAPAYSAPVVPVAPAYSAPVAATLAPAYSAPIIATSAPAYSAPVAAPAY